jgi:GR25 family glycosyltransferase involved in LPS biosynthesis
MTHSLPIFYYINLDHRVDRYVQIEDELDKIGAIHKVRVSAERTPECGALGCCLSHIKALTMFLESDSAAFKTAIILEDDFEFIQPVDAILNMLSKAKDAGEFDVIMLSGNILEYRQTDSPFLNKVINGQTTAGYMITRDFAATLLSHWKKTAMLIKMYLHGTGTHHHELSCDITWKRLQPESKWYIFNPPLGAQRKGYSDIEKRVIH